MSKSTPPPRRRARSAAQDVALADATAIELWNQEDSAEAGSVGKQQLEIVVFSRDWTVETIVSQIQQGNIDLEPDFQRRNAWRDERRSRLIESFVLNFPVPQVVLAEHPKKKKSYIVIDGKQRLLTIAGLFLPEYRDYWLKSRFIGLEIIDQWNDIPLDDFLIDARFDSQRRQLANADIRTTIVSDFSDETILYNIFYRLNTGSVPLSSQELRQVLNQGGFAKHLLERTDVDNPIRSVLGLSGPDARLRDVELLLRLVAWRKYASDYVGNMKPFLDFVMREMNAAWPKHRKEIERVVSEALVAGEAANAVFGDNLGRKFKAGKYERAVNRAVFELQALSLIESSVARAGKQNAPKIRAGYEKLCADTDFLASIESTTKSIENYQYRFDQYRLMLQKATGVKVPRIKFGR